MIATLQFSYKYSSNHISSNPVNINNLDRFIKFGLINNYNIMIAMIMIMVMMMMMMMMMMMIMMITAIIKTIKIIMVKVVYELLLELLN